ncbi:uncharacterized protein LOC118182556 isoform X2 [Stegodyphus dumicola]|nr:uncharacterized protein LOC118182556 isoform X2 [Stegodyphus dumicola]
MVKDFSVEKNLLPPKKVFGNRTESFINNRQKALELYLQTLIYKFSLLPEPLATFLDFPKYEIRAITSSLSETFFSEGEVIISTGESYKFSPLQLHAISERLKLCEPTCYSNNPTQDIAHLVEFVSHLKHLKIVGSNICFGDSNIVPNALSFDLSMFKFLETLEIHNCKLDNNLVSVETLRIKLKSLIVYESLKDLATILLCGIVHWSPALEPVKNWPFWDSITCANFSHNSLKKISPSIKLLSSVKQIDLSYNEIEVIENLETLSELSTLILSHNNIHYLDSLHTQLGNISALYLSSNKINNLQGLSKLFSVSELYLDGNEIASFKEVSCLSKLPCLEVLNLEGNPITTYVDYRPQVLLMLGPLAPELQLDSLKATEKEIDTVSVLQALRQAHGGNISDIDYDSTFKETARSVEQCMHTDSTSRKLKDLSNVSGKHTKSVSDVSKFRHQVETLRRIGGSDWLRLLNEIRSSTSQDSTKDIPESSVSGNYSVSKDMQLHIVHIRNKSFSELEPHTIMQYAVSAELCYPEWWLSDSSNEKFNSILMSILQKDRPDLFEGIKGAVAEATSKSFMFPETDILWVVGILYQESSVYEIPVCVLLCDKEMLLLKLKSFQKNAKLPKKGLDNECSPDISYLRSVLPSHVSSVAIGPCSAYIELKLNESSSSQNLIFLMTNEETAALFIANCKRLFNLTPVYKPNPFANKVIAFENIHTAFPLSNMTVQNQIIFGQRILLSKTLHKSHYGILHYVFVTLSHILLVEERLHIPQVIGLDVTAQPQFHVCAVVNVQTNIKQIHLKDVDYESDLECNSDFNSTEESNVQYESPVENKHFEILYKCGSWLFLEFESGVFLYLKFSNFKKRNEFLDAFLCARSQR